MDIEERFKIFADRFGFEIVDKAIFNIFENDEINIGVPICPCIFTGSNNTEILISAIKHRCPCSEVLDLKSNEICKCGLFKKK